MSLHWLHWFHKGPPCGTPQGFGFRDFRGEDIRFHVCSLFFGRVLVELVPCVNPKHAEIHQSSTIQHQRATKKKHKKNICTFHESSWLFNRDASFMVHENNPLITGQYFIPIIYPTNNSSTNSSSHCPCHQDSKGNLFAGTLTICKSQLICSNSSESVQFGRMFREL